MNRTDLAGRTILVTRAAAQSQEFLKAIESRGGTPLLFPMIEIAPPLSWEACDGAIGRLDRFDGLLFASANGVEGFFHRLESRGVALSALARLKTYAVGQRTKEAIERHAVAVRAVPERFTAADLAAALAQEEVAGRRFLFPRGNLGSALLADGLAARGAEVETVEVYRTLEPARSDVAAVSAVLLSGGVDAVTFASPSAARHFAALFSPDEARRIAHRAAIAAIGPATASALEELGLAPDVVARQSTMEDLLEQVAAHLKNSHHHIIHSQTPMTNTLFLQACRRQPVTRTPVWIMRQAGRFLPEYREVRATVDFLTLCKTPELAAKVTLQPVDILGVDAAIIFSDILVIPEAMGMELHIEEGKGGPQFPAPLRTAAAVDALGVPDPNDKLRYVMDALRLVRRELGGRVPLIGFSGAPWTLASYMVEGHGSRNFRYIKEMMYDHPALTHRLLDKLTRAVTAYLKAQIEAGAQAVQIFDTWGGILTVDAFREFSLPYIERIVHEVAPAGAPVIVFAKDCGHSLREIAGTGCSVVGLDWSIDIGAARAEIGGTVALQGNLDPTILYASPEKIRQEVKSVLKKFGRGPGHVFNLGHGILPDIPVDHVKAFIQAVREESVHYHTSPT